MSRTYYLHLFLIGFCLTTQARTVIEKDSLALVALYNSTAGAGWENSWNLNTPVDTWYGITVDKDRQRVNAVFLDGNNLVGTLPAALGNLKPEALIIRNNKITGSIPSELGNLTPADPGDPNKNKYLRYLYLDNNFLTGTIPKELFNNYALYDLILAGNQLTGTIPNDLHKIARLDSLNLSSNKLSGEIPAVILYTMETASYINLSSNNFTGSLATKYVNTSGDVYIDIDIAESDTDIGSRLTTLLLRGNQLTDLPDLSFLKNKKLTTFEADFNHLSFEAVKRNQSVLTKYTPQRSLGKTFHITDAKIILRSAATGNNNVYQWYKNRTPIAGETADSLVLNSLSETDFGIYHCSVTNPNFAGITLFNPIDTLLGKSSARDSLSLIKLYEATDGNKWFETWDLKKPYLSWRGVSVRNGRVVALNLEKNRLVGTVPAELSNLDSLELLVFSGNKLTGSIPTSLGNLTNLQVLSLDDNLFTGTIPGELSKLTKLTILFLARNKLQGNIPASIADLINLRFLILFSNQLTGKIPTQVGNLTSLVTLNLSDNQLSAAIPSEIGKLTNLQNLLLDSNKLTGSIPSQIGDLSELVDLSLYANQLTGSIPPEISNLTKLRFLNLRSNQLSGSIPSQLATLTNLEWISLRSNLLTGAFPDLKNLTKLEFLWVYDNQLNDLPDLSSLTKLTDFKVQNNRLHFDDIRPNLARLDTSINYSPQIIREGKRYTQNRGSNLTLKVSVAGAGNVYQWYKNKVALAGQTQTSLALTNIQNSDSGYYHCQVSNSTVPGLTLTSEPDTVKISQNPPIAIALTKTEIAEDSPIGTTIGTLSTTDPDAGDTHTYTIEGADAANFKIKADKLENAAVFDFETKSSYVIKIVSTDAGGSKVSQNFTIRVTDVDENKPPTALPQIPIDDAISLISLYPNPSNGLLKINGLNKIHDLTIKVINLKGQVVKTFSKLRATYDLSDLAKGSYIVLIQAGEETKHLKFILN